MKKEREMPLGEALDEIESTVQRLKKEGAARANGYEVKLDEPVTLEIETEAAKGKAELEFDIKWRGGQEAWRRPAAAASGCARGGGDRGGCFFGDAPAAAVRGRKKRSSSAVCGSV